MLPASLTHRVGGNQTSDAGHRAEEIRNPFSPPLRRKSVDVNQPRTQDAVRTVYATRLRKVQRRSNVRRLLPIAAVGLCLALWPTVSHAQPLTGKGTVKD